MMEKGEERRREKCEECGQEMGQRRKNKRFCSAKCRYEFWKRKNRPDGMMLISKQAYRDMQEELRGLRERVMELESRTAAHPKAATGKP
jgi:hypothetical protein